MENKKINLWNTITYVIYAIVIIFAILAISSKFSLFGVKLLVVKSGSMEPTIKTGSLVITKSESSYKIGDIVTFKDRSKPSETITHRIVSQELQNGVALFTTEGDANGSPDSTKLTSGQIVGKVTFKIPYIGYAVAFARTLPGLIIFVIIPAIIIIFDEILKIKEELKNKKLKKAEAK